MAANTPGHPDQEEAKARLAELAGVTREPVAETENFSLELAQQLINSDSKFPVSFDLAWQWIGYSTKGNGKKALLNAGFIKNEELVLDLIQLDKPTTVGITGIQGGDVNENIFLTVECFKMWGMMAKTAQGRKVREYFLECERIAKQSIAQPEPEPASAEPEQPKLGSTIEQTAIALTPLRMLLSTVPEALVDGFLLNRLQAHHPELKPDIEAAHTLLAATNPVPEILLTPTAIGERLGITARAVNTLLTGNGYQAKNSSKGKTEPAYLPTEKSKQHSTNTLATGRGSDNTTYQHIKWNESIVDELRKLI